MTVVGIDLGTTNTVVSAVRDGQASALHDDLGQTLIPSIASFHPNGTVLVGRAAKERRLVDPRNTIYSIKRLIGRSWETDEVRRARQRFAFDMREGPGQAPLVVARGETYTLPEISAFVLRKAKTVAELALGTPIERAVITVPANFNDLQRAATKVAGRVAGLEVLRILNEPTAAALAYGYGKGASERIVVYDFGGGTFDVTLLDLADNVFEVLATAGNTFLGGDDIDQLLGERICEAFLKQQRFDPRSDRLAFERVRLAAEELKIQLSGAPLASVQIPDITHGAGGRALGLNFTMTRGEFESLIAPLVDKTFEVCSEALGIARIAPHDLREVLLVGGSTRIPYVKRRVEEFFGRETKAHINPDEVVAIGAAIQANALTGVERRRGTVPPAPAPAVRSTQPPGFTRNTQPRANRTTSPNFDEREPGTGRLRLSSLPPEPVFDPTIGTSPNTKPFSRGRSVTADGLAPYRPAQSSAPPAPEPTARQRMTTGMGLGPVAPATTRITGSPFPDVPPPPPPPPPPPAAAGVPVPLPPAPAPRSPHLDKPTLLSAGDAAARALVKADAARREESVITALDDADLQDFSRHDIPVPPPPLTEPLPLPLPEVPRVPAAALAGTAVMPSSGFGQVAAPWAPATMPTPPPPTPAPPAPAQVPTFAGGTPHSVARASQRPYVMPEAPVLVDVTPLTLSVETVRGYCDRVIDRNTPVPCERTREFVTAADNQTAVKVRISQGESNNFGENTLLGELELAGLRPAPRGAVQISVTFALDTSGMLSVSARDVATGRATSAQVRLVGLPNAAELASLSARHAAHGSG
jgi:molecular chaperone DnaK